jgi:hypothetical protein
MVSFANCDTVSERVVYVFCFWPKTEKHASALIGALATGCEAPGLYGKKPLLVVCPTNKLQYSAQGLKGFCERPKMVAGVSKRLSNRCKTI